MELEIKPLQRRDFAKATHFAIQGMHFSRYLDSRLLLRLYGRYFWYLELSKATQVIVAYRGDNLAGVLLAKIEGEPPAAPSPWRALYVRLVNLVQRTFFSSSAGQYETANQRLWEKYQRTQSPDGEILFLAADPNTRQSGVGTQLLSELTVREQGKSIYLFTDDACNYSFYDHRGFRCAGKETILLDLGKKPLSMTCMLYEKTL